MLTDAEPTGYQGGVTRPGDLHGAVVSTTWRDTSRSLTDLIFGCVRDTLDQAGLPPPISTPPCWPPTTSWTDAA